MCLHDFYALKFIFDEKNEQGKRYKINWSFQAFTSNRRINGVRNHPKQGKSKSKTDKFPPRILEEEWYSIRVSFGTFRPPSYFPSEISGGLA